MEEPSLLPEDVALISSDESDEDEDDEEEDDRKDAQEEIPQGASPDSAATEVRIYMHAI